MENKQIIFEKGKLEDLQRAVIGRKLGEILKKSEDVLPRKE